MSTSPDIDNILTKTLEDHRLSRSERRAFGAVLDGMNLERRELEVIRAKAFDQARAALADGRDAAVLEWLEDVVAVLAAKGSPGARGSRSVAFFSPGEDCRKSIRELARSARRSLWICVFTITDNRIADAILDAYRRRVDVRILTDNEKAEDLGSDIEGLERSGVPVRVDVSDKHMHHKFAIADGKRVLTGSYNWTRAAAEENEENLVVSDDVHLVRAFSAEFEKLWALYS